MLIYPIIKLIQGTIRGVSISKEQTGKNRKQRHKQQAKDNR